MVNKQQVSLYTIKSYNLKNILIFRSSKKPLKTNQQKIKNKIKELVACLKYKN